MTAPFSVRVAQFIRLLGSDVDGEVVAATRALGKTLRAAGIDWHDLAIAVESGFRAQPRPVNRPWQATARELLRRGGRLRPHELDFLQSMATWPTPPTVRQAAWLADIGEALEFAA